MTRRLPGPGDAATVALVAVVLLVVLTLVDPAAAQAPTGSGPRSAPHTDPATTRDEAGAMALLRRATAAPLTTPYTGVEYVTTGDGDRTATFVLDVEHLPGIGTRVRARGTGLPETGGTVEQRAAGVDAVWLLARSYDLALAGAASVAGRRASVITVRRGDGTLAGRFWVDTRTGLLLRREVYNGDGTVLRASAFVDLHVGGPLLVRSDAGRPGTAATGPLAEAVNAVRAAGWSCPGPWVAGLALVSARDLTTSSGPVMHLTYSDGLARVSVFEQRGWLDTARLPGLTPARIGGTEVWTSPGYPRRVVWSGRGIVYTAVAEAPGPLLGAVLAAFPHAAAPAPPSVLGRVSRGVGRVASWFNPFR